jgi:hypothetical protein
MNGTKPMKSNSYERLIKHRQINAPAKADRDPTIIGFAAESVTDDFMPLKPVFSTACLISYKRAVCLIRLMISR